MPWTDRHAAAKNCIIIIIDYMCTKGPVGNMRYNCLHCNAKLGPAEMKKEKRVASSRNKIDKGSKETL
jgi:hypothetical protein